MLTDGCIYLALRSHEILIYPTKFVQIVGGLPVVIQLASFSRILFPPISENLQWLYSIVGVLTTKKENKYIYIYILHISYPLSVISNILMQSLCNNFFFFIGQAIFFSQIMIIDFFGAAISNCRNPQKFNKYKIIEIMTTPT